ncbi:hypothetical protein ACXIVK_27935 [Paraburkholderia caledonica]|jgi:hypothetical protein
MQTQNTVTATMLACTRNMVITIAAIAVLVVVLIGVGHVAPIVGGWISSAWYGWARILTNDYTSVKVAACVEWGSMLVAIWALCVTIKLTNTNEGASAAFAGLMVAVLLLGLLPAQCALYVMCSDWTLAEHPLFEQLAGLTGMLVYIISFIAVPGVALFLFVEVIA